MSIDDNILDHKYLNNLYFRDNVPLEGYSEYDESKRNDDYMKYILSTKTPEIPNEYDVKNNTRSKERSAYMLGKYDGMESRHNNKFKVYKKDSSFGDPMAFCTVGNIKPQHMSYNPLDKSSFHRPKIFFSDEDMQRNEAPLDPALSLRNHRKGVNARKYINLNQIKTQAIKPKKTIIHTNLYKQNDKTTADSKITDISNETEHGKKTYNKTKINKYLSLFDDIKKEVTVVSVATGKKVQKNNRLKVESTVAYSKLPINNLTRKMLITKQRDRLSSILYDTNVNKRNAKVTKTKNRLNKLKKNNYLTSQCNNTIKSSTEQNNKYMMKFRKKQKLAHLAQTGIVDDSNLKIINILKAKRKQRSTQSRKTQSDLIITLINTAKGVNRMVKTARKPSKYYLNDEYMVVENIVAAVRSSVNKTVKNDYLTSNDMHQLDISKLNKIKKYNYEKSKKAEKHVNNGDFYDKNLYNDSFSANRHVSKGIKTSKKTSNMYETSMGDSGHQVLF